MLIPQAGASRGQRLDFANIYDTVGVVMTQIHMLHTLTTPLDGERGLSR